MTRFLKASILTLLIALSVPSVTLAQPSGAVQAQTPLTRDLGAIITLKAQGAAAVASSDQSGFNAARVVCAFRQSTSSVSASSVLKIQNKDAASGQYYDLISSASVSQSQSSSTPVPVSAGAGLPNTTNVSAGVPLARTWRAVITVSGTTAAISGTVGCSIQ